MPEQILQTAGETYRRRLHYERAAIGVTGSWNPDASFANLRDNDYTDILNLRMQTVGGYECRTGYNKYESGTHASLEVLAKCEYRHKVENVDVYFDITVYQVGGSVFIQGINRAPLAGGPWSTAFTIADLANVGGEQTVNPIVTGLPTIATVTNPPAIAACVQFGVYIVVTIYGTGTFVIFPADKPATDWHIRDLGKKLTVTPWEVNYADTFNGDLWLTLFDDSIATLTTRIAHHWTAKPVLQGTVVDPRMPPYQYLQVPLGATYKRSDLNSGIDFQNTEHKYYEWDSHDPKFDPISSPQPVRSTRHLRKAGWGYRFIIKRSFTDTRGNTITYRSQASVDIWVNDTIYCPPQIYDTTTSVNGDYVKKQQFVDLHGLSFGTLPTNGKPKFVFFGHLWYNDNGVIGVASAQDVEDLARKFIAYYGQSWQIDTIYNNNVGLDETLLLPAMAWLGFRRVQSENPSGIWKGDEYNFDSTYKDAWMSEVPASLLAGAPLTTFKWTDFSTTDGTTPNPDFPSDATEIEIYRTAWTDSDAKLTNNDPAFQPHLYGYVGSIKKDATFVDNINDNDVQFGQTPDQYDGYLEGQFSGQVVREQSGKVALGNCSTSYFVFDPSGIFPFIVGSVGTGATLPSTDINVIDFYYIQYVDENGDVSDLAQIPWDSSNTTGNYDTVAVPLPTGYDPTIVEVDVWYKHNADYKRIATAAPTDNQAVITVDHINSVSVTTPPTNGNKSNPKVIAEGGEVIWSNVNEPFDFAPLNARIVRKTGNITAMQSEVGELMIFSDTAIDYDNLNNVDPRGEEVTDKVGCIGRTTICKVDKINFIMTANGLYFAEPGGVVSFPANVQSVVLDYIREEIPGVAPLANARRATIGYDGKRYELWVHFPSSEDLYNPADTSQHGLLPEITIIYKFFNPEITRATVATFVNYKFDLLVTADNAVANPFNRGVAATWNQPQFLTTSDGKLFCSYKESSGGSFKIATIDCDTDTVWTNKTAFEHVYGMGEMNVQKMMREIQIAGDFNCNLQIRHGVPNPLLSPDPVNGWINPLCPAHIIALPANSYNVSFPHRLGATSLGSMSVAEMYAATPVVRLESTPNIGGAHTVTYKAIDLHYKPVHEQPI